MIGYCFKWNYADGGPGRPLTEAAARARDTTGQEYTALLTPRPGCPWPTQVTVVRRTGVVVVTFLDDPGRQATTYTFMQKTDEWCFLTKVHLWTYPSDEPGLRLSHSSAQEIVYYAEDGTVRRTTKNKAERTQEIVDYRDVPVDDNWERLPEFGDFSSIARFERSGT